MAITHRSDFVTHYTKFEKYELVNGLLVLSLSALLLGALNLKSFLDFNLSNIEVSNLVDW